MIATELYDGQGLGNQLWVYSACRSIAEQLGVDFVLQGIERFKGSEFLDIDPLISVESTDPYQPNIASFPVMYEKMYYDGQMKYVSSSFDSQVLLNNGNTKLEGLFQSEKYFFGNLQRLGKYIRLRSDWIRKVSVPGDTCVINVRGGEYKRHRELVLPVSYWSNAVRNMKDISDVKKFLIVTDDVKYAKAILPGYEVLSGGVGDCYAAIYNASHLILSNSSFAYFPAKTGLDKKFVVAPMYWARFGNRFGRWASPANLYQSWLWQDQEGGLHDFHECVTDRDASELHYETNYFLRTTPDQLLEGGFRKLIPLSVRRNAKRLLSVVFPTKFG